MIEKEYGLRIGTLTPAEMMNLAESAFNRFKGLFDSKYREMHPEFTGRSTSAMAWLPSNKGQWAGIAKAFEKDHIEECFQYWFARQDITDFTEASFLKNIGKVHNAVVEAKSDRAHRAYVREETAALAPMSDRLARVKQRSAEWREYRGVEKAPTTLEEQRAAFDSLDKSEQVDATVVKTEAVKRPLTKSKQEEQDRLDALYEEWRNYG